MYGRRTSHVGTRWSWKYTNKSKKLLFMNIIKVDLCVNYKYSSIYIKYSSYKYEYLLLFHDYLHRILRLTYLTLQTSMVIIMYHCYHWAMSVFQLLDTTHVFQTTVKTSRKWKQKCIKKYTYSFKVSVATKIIVKNLVGTFFEIT